jgi:hypothetical protein
MKNAQVVEVQLHTFLTSALDGCTRFKSAYRHLEMDWAYNNEDLKFWERWMGKKNNEEIVFIEKNIR